MTTAAAPQPSQPSENVWEKHRVGSISKDHKFIRLIDQHDNNDEYKADEVDISELRTGDIVHAWIENGRLKGVKFPPGMEPITNVPVVKGKSSTPQAPSEAPQQPAQKPADPVQEISGDVSMITEKGIKIVSHEMVFINGVSLGDIKHGHSVKAKIQGNTLLEIQKVTAPAASPSLKEDQTALKSVHLDDAQPHVILMNLKGEFRKIVEREAFDQVKEVSPGKLIRYSTDKSKPGNPIKSFWEVDDAGKSIKSRGGKGGGRPFDPVADAKRQRLIVRQSSLERSLQAWMNGNPGKEPSNEDDERILLRMEKYSERVMRE